MLQLLFRRNLLFHLCDLTKTREGLPVLAATRPAGDNPRGA
jgi:hypothetical protein